MFCDAGWPDVCRFCKTWEPRWISVDGPKFPCLANVGGSALRIFAIDAEKSMAYISGTCGQQHFWAH